MGVRALGSLQRKELRNDHLALDHHSGGPGALQDKAGRLSPRAPPLPKRSEQLLVRCGVECDPADPLDERGDTDLSEQLQVHVLECELAVDAPHGDRL